jgi:hypothetical protein
MGMRRNIILQYEKDRKIYLYTHWGAEGLEDILADALDKGRSRWSDTSYLARYIFSRMTKDVGDALTGFGLSVSETTPDYKSLEVDLENKTVNDVEYEDFVKNPQMFKI